MVVIDGIVRKDRRIIVPASLQQRALTQLFVNYMGIEKIGLLVTEFIYWLNINTFHPNYWNFFSS